MILDTTCLAALQKSEYKELFEQLSEDHEFILIIGKKSARKPYHNVYHIPDENNKIIDFEKLWNMCIALSNTVGYLSSGKIKVKITCGNLSIDSDEQRKDRISEN